MALTSRFFRPVEVWLMSKVFMHAGKKPGDRCRETFAFILFRGWVRKHPQRTNPVMQKLSEGTYEEDSRDVREWPFQVVIAVWEWFDSAARATALETLARMMHFTRVNSYRSVQPSFDGVHSLIRCCVAENPACLFSDPEAARAGCSPGYELALSTLRDLVWLKEFHDSVVLELSSMTPERLRASGLLQDDDSAVRTLVLQGLCSCESPEAALLLRDCLQQSGWNELQRGWMLDRLEALGEGNSSLDPLHGADVDSFERAALADLKGKRGDPLKRLWSDRIDQMDLPFSRKTLQWCARLLIDDEGNGLPRRFSQLWMILPQEDRAELVFRLVEAWGKGKADNQDRWVLRLVGAFGDDRLVPLLKELVVLWNKKRYVRATDVIGALSQLDTLRALFVLDEIGKNVKFSESVRERALQELEETAMRRGVALEELYDELVPTFDLGPEGLMLDVGPYSYQVRLLPDLTLQVIHTGTGKVTRSLPKAKKDEDPQLRAVAVSRLALLKKNIKPLVKQLEPRLEEALECSKAWPAERWQKLFLVHPILNLVGQSLVWSYSDGDSSCSFRISEDGSLIDLNDSPVTLGSGEVRLWHPLEASTEEIDGWRAHLADYELVPLIAQTEAPVHHVHADEHGQDWLERFCDDRVPWSRLKRLMSQWGFTWYHESTCILSYEHTWSFSRIRVEVEIQECWMYMEFNEECVLGTVHFERVDPARKSCTRLALDKVPPRIFSTMIGKLTELTTS